MLTDVSQRFTFKFLLVGNSAVGKTSIVRRFCRDEFDESTVSTVSVEFMTSIIKVNNTDVRLQIWDTAGQEVYRSLSKAYFRNAVGVLLCFSLTDHDSFEAVEEWYKEVRDLCHPKAVVKLVATKLDLINDKRVSTTEATKFADDHNLEYIETSAKDNSNIQDLFFKMAETVYNNVLTGEIDLKDSMTAAAPVQNKKPAKKFCSIF